MMKRAHSPDASSAKCKAPGVTYVADDKPRSTEGKEEEDKGRGDNTELASEERQASRGEDVFKDNKPPQELSSPGATRLDPSRTQTTTPASAGASATIPTQQLRRRGEEEVPSMTVFVRGAGDGCPPALLSLEELSRTAASVRSSGLSAEEVQREMGIIYSRRKRVRQKMRQESLKEKKQGLLQENVRLKGENTRLEMALRKAFSDVAAFEQRFASAHAHASMGSPGWDGRPPPSGVSGPGGGPPPYHGGSSTGYLPPPHMYYGGSPMGFYGPPHHPHHPPPHSPGSMYPPPVHMMHPHHGGQPYMSAMNPYGPPHPPAPHPYSSPVRRVPPPPPPLPGAPKGDANPRLLSSSPKHMQGWDPDQLRLHFTGGPTGGGGGNSDYEQRLVASVPAKVLRGLLREWKKTAPEAARNLEEYLENQRGAALQQKEQE